MERNGTAAGDLTARQGRFLAALLSESSVEAAAQKAGVGHVTAFRWLIVPVFRDAYRAAKREAVSVAVGRLQAASGAMVDVLRAVAEDAGTPPSARVAAARTVLELSIKAVEVEDLAVRLEELEGALAELKGSEPATANDRHQWH